MQSSRSGGGEIHGRRWRSRAWLAALCASLLALVFADGCSLIIGNELDGKPNASSGAGGAHVDGGFDGGTGGQASGGSDSGVDAADGSSEDAADAGDGGDGSDGALPPCTMDADCASTPSTAICDTATGVCVQCLMSATCPSGQNCANNICALQCTSASQCSFANAVPICSGGVCVLDHCDPNFGDCNGNTSDGCETELDKSPTNCGTCANDCTAFLDVASAVCDAGVCQINQCTAGFKDCDSSIQNGCEVSVLTDVNNCGDCGVTCKVPNAIPKCSGGACGILNCLPGFFDCDGNPANGCEVNGLTDPTHCNGCGVLCTRANATAACMAGSCQIGACNPGFGDCNGVDSDGCEINLNTNAANCAACGSACSTNHNTPTCVAGACTVKCKTGFADCDNNVADGCEASTATDVANCGMCGMVCPNGSGTATCSNSMCGVSACYLPLGDCNGGGCSVMLNTTSNCGGCGIECTTANGTPACTSYMCATGSCNAGFADCNGLPVDGCETNTGTSVQNCGGCNQACNLPNATPVCASGSCGIVSCQAGFADCDGNVANGCEINIAGDTSNCGACNKVCNGTNGAPKCTSGTCSIVCSPGFGNCDGVATNGCEANLQTDPTHCGSCSTACNLPHAVAACSNGTCAVGSCKAPFADCDGNPANGCETDLTADPANCGACGKVCNGENGKATCSGSVCGIVCTPGFANCDGNLANGCEVTLASDVNNCNGCGNVCSTANGTPNCVGGMCGVASCMSNFGDCSGGNSCSTMLLNDPLNCGKCGNVCSVANGTGICTNGTCAVGTCNAGYKDCDGTYANGCETNLSTNANCGGCGTKCSANHAVTSCSTGTCMLVSCSSPFADCNGSLSDGCEVNLQTDTGNCGKCANVCNGTNAMPQCTAGACVPLCDSGFGDCDKDPSNGCESTLGTDVNNCGACGRQCSATNVASLDCNAGVCDSTCAFGFANCTMPPFSQHDDGCELNVTSSAAACGGCTNACSMQGTVGLECDSNQMSPGLCSCSTDNECNVGAAAGNCGPTGTCVCNGATCNSGEVCVNEGTDLCSCNSGSACTAPQICCLTPGCVDPTSDPANCGACGHACTAGFACQSGSCACTASSQCGIGGACLGSGVCQCGGVACTVGQRCLPGGGCG